MTITEGPRLDQLLTRALVILLGELRRAEYRFVTPTPATIARVNARPGNEEATDLSGIFGWSRPFPPDLLPQALRGPMAEAGLLLEAGGRLRSAVRVSSLGPDLFVHSAFPTVAADSVFFGPDTYRFVSALHGLFADSARPVRRAVDIGCGAGPGGIAVARHHPGAEVVLVDINRTALLYAAANAASAGLPGVTTAESNLLSGLDGLFDLIVSNPPYLNDPLARAYRHGGGALGEALSLRIVDEALARLAPGGTLALYTGVAIVEGRDLFRQTATERLRVAEVDWSYREIDPDVFGEELETDAYRGADRIAAVVLTARQRS